MKLIEPHFFHDVIVCRTLVAMNLGGSEGISYKDEPYFTNSLDLLSFVYKM